MNYNLKKLLFLLIPITFVGFPGMPRGLEQNLTFDDRIKISFEYFKNFNHYTFGFEPKNINEKEKIEWILENRDSQILDICEGKIYFNSDKVLENQFGKFIRVDGIIIVKMDHLSQDEKGFYICLID